MGSIGHDFLAVFTKSRDKAAGDSPGHSGPDSSVGANPAGAPIVLAPSQRDPNLLARPVQLEPNGESKMSTPNPVLAAAEPALLAVLQSLQTFIANLGTDPLQVAVKFPGAVQVLLGNIELQLPVLAGSEFAALQGQVNAKLEAWVKQLTVPK